MIFKARQRHEQKFKDLLSLKVSFGPLGMLYRTRMSELYFTQKKNFSNYFHKTVGVVGLFQEKVRAQQESREK